MVKVNTYTVDSEYVKKNYPVIYRVFNQKPPENAPTPGYDYFKQVALELSTKVAKKQINRLD